MVNLSTFYQSKPWVKLMDMLKIARVSGDGNLYCEHCGEPIVRKYDCIGHHITMLTEENVKDSEISLNPDNIMLVHHRCHNMIHKRFGFEDEKQVFLVYGSPCAGKSTFVANAADTGDLVLDMDKIWQMISINDNYTKPVQLKNNVFAVRNFMMDMIKTRYGKWRNAWVIGGYPLIGERERLIKSLGAREVFMEEKKEVCLERAGDRSEEWIKFVEDWWDKYQPTPQVEDF